MTFGSIGIINRLSIIQFDSLIIISYCFLNHTFFEILIALVLEHFRLSLGALVWIFIVLFLFLVLLAIFVKQCVIRIIGIRSGLRLILIWVLLIRLSMRLAIIVDIIIHVEVDIVRIPILIYNISLLVLLELWVHRIILLKKRMTKSLLEYWVHIVIILWTVPSIPMLWLLLILHYKYIYNLKFESQCSTLLL